MNNTLTHPTRTEPAMPYELLLVSVFERWTSCRWQRLRLFCNLWLYGWIERVANVPESVGIISN